MTRRAERRAPRIWLLLLLGCAARRSAGPAPPPPAALGFDGTLAIGGRYQGQRLRARALLVVEPGGRLYFEVYEGPAAVLACDGERVTSILVGRREWVEAMATPRTMKALVGVPLDPAEIGAILTGAFPEGERQGVRVSYAAPGKIKVEVAAEKLSLDLTLRAARSKGPPRPAGLFRPEAPADFRRVAIEDFVDPAFLLGGER